MPGKEYTREHMRQFVIAAAAYDRKHHPRTWKDDDDIVAACHGHALCFANAHRVQVTLNNADLAFGLAAYRRARAQRRPKSLVSVALPLLRVFGVRHGNAA